MAVKKTTIILTWENNGEFKMTSKMDGDIAETKVICHLQEDGHIDDIWQDAQNVCTKYFSATMKAIGAEMKK
jgi:hypothetical protein